MFDFTQGLIGGVKRLAGEGKAAVEQATQKPIKYIVLDSLIIAGIALFAVSPTACPTIDDLWTMLKAGGAAFLLELAVERGLKRKQ